MCEFSGGRQAVERSSNEAGVAFISYATSELVIDAQWVGREYCGVGAVAFAMVARTLWATAGQASDLYPDCIAIVKVACSDSVVWGKAAPMRGHVDGLISFPFVADHLFYMAEQGARWGGAYNCVCGAFEE